MTRRYYPVLEDPHQSSSALTLHTVNAALPSVASASPSYSDQLTARRGRTLLRRAPRRSKLLVLAVASILSLVTILALLALCRTSQRRLNYGAAVQRRLSDTEDAHDRSDALEQCLDLEQELGLHPAVSEYVEEASEAKSRLVAMLYDSAVNFERMRAVAPQMLQDDAQPPPPKIPRLNEPSPSTSHSEASFRAFWQRGTGAAAGGVVSALDPDAWTREEFVLEVGEGEQQSQTVKLEELLGLQWGASALPEVPAPFHEGKATPRLSALSPVSRAHSGEYAVTSDSWIEGSFAHKHEQAVHQQRVGIVARRPAADATSAASISGMSVSTPNELAGRADLRTPRADVAQASAVRPIQRKSVQQLGYHMEPRYVMVKHLDTSPAAQAVPATSSGGGEPCEATNISLHPFVRLPAVNPKDVRRSFRGERALAPYFGRPSPMDSYVRMRSLFVKASLTPEEAEALMLEAERLASYAIEKLTRPNKKTTASVLFRRLSSMFMVFDHLVCTIEVLGDKMDTGSWWAEFAQKFSTQYFLSGTAKWEKTKELSKLVNRLSSALAVYKEGKRPAFTEIIQLKRAIILHASKDSQLSHPLWKLWMQDDEDFSSSNRHLDFPSYHGPPGEEETKEP